MEGEEIRTLVKEEMDKRLPKSYPENLDNGKLLGVFLLMGSGILFVLLALTGAVVVFDGSISMEAQRKTFWGILGIMEGIIWLAFLLILSINLLISPKRKED